jgi:AcrR family transcriptional regulator
MADSVSGGRAKQRSRTRKDLLQAAARLMRRSPSPSLDAIAREALVSRATAYRYFPRVEALLVEAALDVEMPDAETLFDQAAPADPVARVERLDRAMNEMMQANETALRTMLVHSLEQRLAGGGRDDVPARQNRRLPLIEAALAPLRRELEPAAIDRLAKALALIVGTEAMIVFRDVLRLDRDEAGGIKGWAIRALIDAARRRS